MTGNAGIIAIDGQAAAGKTAVGRELARRLGCPFLDTGIMYRAITWLALREAVAWEAVALEEETALGKLTKGCTMRLTGTDGASILLNGRELGAELRTAAVDDHVSLVARIPDVRRELVRQQRDIAARSEKDLGGIVMVGRDIGTVVLPDAALKVFMVASPEVRAQRRYDELVAQGQSPDYGQVLNNALSRDSIDSQRADSPLAQAIDAVLVDTSDLSIDQVVQDILEQLRTAAGGDTP